MVDPPTDDLHCAYAELKALKARVGALAAIGGQLVPYSEDAARALALNAQGLAVGGHAAAAAAPVRHVAAP